jgi:DNA-binding transcriptional LysR family regulator
LLFAEQLVPVAAPAYLESLRVDGRIDLEQGELLAKLTLLEYQRIAPDLINWQLWIEKTGLARLGECRIESCHNYTQAIGAALGARGIALGSRGLIDAELRSGRLLVVGDIELSSGRAYYLSQPRRKALSPAAEILRQMLLAG